MIPVSDTAHPAPQNPVPPRDAATVVILRDAGSMRETFEEAGLRLEAGALVPWVRWVTPVIWPRRFQLVEGRYRAVKAL